MLSACMLDVCGEITSRGVHLGQCTVVPVDERLCVQTVGLFPVNQLRRKKRPADILNRDSEGGELSSILRDIMDFLTLNRPCLQTFVCT